VGSSGLDEIIGRLACAHKHGEYRQSTERKYADELWFLGRRCGSVLLGLLKCVVVVQNLYRD